ncbi:MAG: pyruvate kinase [Oscillospiraceae bacterium]|jgi:pyruvate kinase|nr:pyruvate kinase [Oscillospiraceae bacterium]
MRKTKIVATLGPATDSPDILREMLISGLNVARFNFSHGNHEEHKARLSLLQRICEETGKNVAFLADTKGPEIRLGTFENKEAILSSDNIFTLTTDTVIGDASRVSISYTGLPAEVTTGTRILLADGLIELVVESVSGKNIITRIINGGKISDRKGVNVPGVHLGMPYICAKDRLDLRFIIENGFDFVAASFVRSAKDVNEMRDELHRLDSKNNIKIISKIENAEGVYNVESILNACDGLMIARGDLGVEVEYEELPIIQKDLITRTLIQGKPVITATQMLESMINNPRPTRAETSDVANAIYDGTSAIMLSGETAVGKYPAQVVSVMSKIAERIENAIDYRENFRLGDYESEPSITSAISHATVTTSHDLRASAILTVSMSGNTAQNVSKYRPTCPIIACTPDPVVRRQLNLNWGVIPLLTRKETDTAALFNLAVDSALKAGHIREGELVVLTAGVPVGHSGTTNLLKVHIVGENILV